MGHQEPHEAQQVQNPGPGEEQPHAPVCAVGHPAGKQHGQKGPGSPDGYQDEHEPGMCPCCKEGKWAALDKV